MFRCGSIPKETVCSQSFWWDSWTWCRCKSCLSSGYTRRYHRGWEWGWKWRASARSRCEAGLPLCLVAVLVLSGSGFIPSCWSRSLEGQVQGGSVSFNCMFFLSPSTENPAWEWRITKARAAREGFQLVLDTEVWAVSIVLPVQVPTRFPCCAQK